MVDRAHVQRNQASVRLEKCLAANAAGLGPMEHDLVPGLQPAPAFGPLLGPQGSLCDVPNPLEKEQTRHRGLDGQSPLSPFWQCKRSSHVGPEIQKIRTTTDRLPSKIQARCLISEFCSSSRLLAPTDIQPVMETYALVTNLGTYMALNFRLYK